MSAQLSVGYARVDITPEEFTNLGGNGLDAKRMADKILERLYGTCVAITDPRGETVLCCPVDILYARSWFAIPAREAMSRATGVPVSRIMINASHCHSGPGVSSPGLETVQRWAKHFIRQMTKCAKEAMENRAPTQILAGRREVQGMTFVRHYHMNDGTVAGPHSGSFESGVKAFLTEPDNQLQVIRFVREGARDVVLVNWQCHPTTAGWVDRYAIWGDYIYSMRNHLEGSTGTYFAFFQGAAGNLICSTKFKGQTAIVPVKDVDRYGRAMAEHVIACLQENMEPVSGGPVRGTVHTFVGEIDHSDDRLAEKAAQVRDRFLTYPLDQKEEAVQMIKEAGFNGFLHANGIVRRSQMGQTMGIGLHAIGVGDIGFAFAPYEMFCSNGMYIKAHSPFKMTFVVSCACDSDYNDAYNYMPDDTAFDYDLYEINTRIYGRGAAERLAEAFVEMLNKVKE